MTLEARYVARSDVVDCDIGGDRALLHLETNSYFTLNVTGAAVWLALAEPCSIAEIVAIVTDRFDVTAEDCRPDVEALINQMVEAQILRAVPAE